MQRAASQCQRTNVMLSENYLKSVFTQPEWAAAFAVDPQGLAHKLIPVRVDRCHPEGLLKAIVYIDLVGLDSLQARKVLLEGLRDRAKPSAPPVFPGGPTKPVSPVSAQPSAGVPAPKAFPGALSRVIDLWQEKLAYFLEQEPLVVDPAQKYACKNRSKNAGPGFANWEEVERRRQHVPAPICHDRRSAG